MSPVPEQPQPIDKMEVMSKAVSINFSGATSSVHASAIKGEGDIAAADSGALTVGAKSYGKPVNITPFGNGNTPVTGASTNFKYAQSSSVSNESPLKGEIRDFNLGSGTRQMNLHGTIGSSDR